MAAVEYRCCDSGFFTHIATIVFLVVFAGLMSGLTLGLMSMSLVDLEVLAKSGSPSQRKHAEKILPVVKKQHLLLCTLLICNAAAMETLPIFLDGLVTAWGAILISVTLILFFGEIIPQAICSRYGLAVGATVAPLVRVLVWICFPVAYPISKLLDFLLGEGHEALFRRAELMTLVDLHGNEAGKGGELTRDETTIIAGALGLTEKTARDAMTPLAETFSIDVNAKLDWSLMKLILEKGHSRVPVYHEQPQNIIGLILVKNLVTTHPEDEVPVKNVTVRKIPRVSESLPLYDILNEFQKGHSHMAVVIEDRADRNPATDEHRCYLGREVRLEIDGDPKCRNKCWRNNKGSIKKVKTMDNDKKISSGKKSGSSKSMKWAKDESPSQVLHLDDDHLPELTRETEAIGIITLEDVIEELLQEEIFDETDHKDQ